MEEAFEPIDPAVAVARISALLDSLAAKSVEPIGGSVHLHATDAAGEWWISQENGKWLVEAVHRKGDVALRGTAAELLRVLNRRIDLSQLEVVGDHDLGERFLQRLALS